MGLWFLSGSLFFPVLNFWPREEGEFGEGGGHREASLQGYQEELVFPETVSEV